ncbi:hypothetical protein ACIA5G_39410 [Amycolatopsis sp. NPDC051758]|uniref:hypothetical protein n=1 Tax=Amycolatopsis sp. NPDC051758 TaxID=3363935 RepID=UPI00379D69A5
METVITVMAGTITGTVLCHVFKNRADTAGRVHEWQVTIVAIFGDLMAALSAHYAATWDLDTRPAPLRGGRDRRRARGVADHPGRHYPAAHATGSTGQTTT